MGVRRGPRTEAASWALVGREDERALVLDALRPDRGGVMVAGTAGVGKSRLARESLDAAAAADRGLSVEWILATRAAASVPFGAFAHLLAHDEGGAGRDRLALFRSTARALQARAGNRRLVIGVDDAHLLDQGSAALVLYLASRGVATIVATVRSGEPWPDAISALWKDGYLTRLDLQALAEDEVGALLEAVLGGPVARKCRRWAFERSDGVPLFLRELVTGALEAGALQPANGLWQHISRAAPTARLVELVESRLNGLSSAERRALEVVAFGEPLPLAALTRLVGMADIERLEAVHLVAADPDTDATEVRLTHPLYGDVVRRGIGVVRAAAIRSDLADAMSDLRRPVDLLRVTTWRLDAGETGSDPEVLTAAAREAARVFDHALAARIGAAALDAGAGLPAAMIRAGALRAVGDFAGADQLLASVEGAASSSPIAYDYLFVRLATLLWGLGRIADVEALLTRAAGWRADPDWQHRVTHQRVVLLSTTGRSEQATSTGLALLAEPRLIETTRIGVAVSVAYSLGQLGRGQQALAVLDDAMATAPGVTLSDWQPDAMWAQIALHCGVGGDGVEPRLVRLHDDACHTGNDTVASWAELLLGGAALERGRVATARRWLREAIASLEREDPRGLLPGALGRLAVAEAAAGHGPEAAEAFARATSALNRRPNAWIGKDEVALAGVWAAAVAGETSRATELAQAYARSTMEAAPQAAGRCLHEALRVGAPAGEVVAELRSAADGTESPLLRACAGHAEALAADDCSGLERAARAFADIGALLRGAEAAADASAAFERAGLAARARAAAAYSGSLAGQCEDAHTPRLQSTAPVALSTRELEVARLAARGLSNAEIADRLTLSVRTVESHVYRASTKLGVSRREDIGRLLGIGAGAAAHR